MNTLLLLVPVLLAVAGLAAWRQVYPDRRMMWLALGPVLFSLLLLVWPDNIWVLVVLDSLILAIVAFDLGTLPHESDFQVTRSMGRIASLKKSHRVVLTISHLGHRDREVWIRDGVPADIDATPEVVHLRLTARSRSTAHYQISALRRGQFNVAAIYLRVQSRLGLWQRHLAYPAESRLNVYPDMQQLTEYGLLARTNRLSLMGLRRTRKVGGDNEFERLRDYTQDDNYKYIDWRSTARRNKLTVKDFQANQSQRIIFLIDCGRMMTGEAAGVSLLDHALNAMLMMSHVALRQGDQVGLLCFSDQIQGYVPPRGGRGQMNQLLHASYDRFPQLVESRYDQAFLHLGRQCRRRALVVLVTNVIDEVNAHQVRRYLTNFVGRHLPLGILLRDHAIFDQVELAGQALDTVDDDRLYRAAGAAEMLTWRHQVVKDLKSKGVLTLDVFPEAMTAPLVNQYLEVKARHLL